MFYLKDMKLKKGGIVVDLFHFTALFWFVMLKMSDIAEKLYSVGFLFQLPQNTLSFFCLVFREREIIKK